MYSVQSLFFDMQNVSYPFLKLSLSGELARQRLRGFHSSGWFICISSHCWRLMSTARGLAPS